MFSYETGAAIKKHEQNFTIGMKTSPFSGLVLAFSRRRAAQNTRLIGNVPGGVLGE
jgi:hypothetical protein